MSTMRRSTVWSLWRKRAAQVWLLQMVRSLCCHRLKGCFCLLLRFGAVLYRCGRPRPAAIFQLSSAGDLLFEVVLRLKGYVQAVRSKQFCFSSFTLDKGRCRALPSAVGEVNFEIVYTVKKRRSHFIKKCPYGNNRQTAVFDLLCMYGALVLLAQTGASTIAEFCLALKDLVLKQAFRHFVSTAVHLMGLHSKAGQ